MRWSSYIGYKSVKTGFIAITCVFVALFTFNRAYGTSPSNATRQNTLYAQDTSKTDYKVGLVLSGGGAKGLSHIGVIKALEENNVPIDYICGTSMGAIIGGLYAIGYSTDEMIALIKSHSFNAWSKGKAEIPYAEYYYKSDPDATMAKLNLGAIRNMTGDTVKRFQLALPTSLISSYPMDLAVLEIFAPASKACGYDFNNLMIPFFCITTDLNHHRQRIERHGNLGTAIRASMSIPLVFKPVNNNGNLLYDGGLYNNFPWQELKNIYNPHLIIGSECTPGNFNMDEENAASLLLGLMIDNTDYHIPDSIGILLNGNYDKFGILEFDSLDEIVKIGYELTLQNIDKIKQRAGRSVSAKEVAAKREAFKNKLTPIRFRHDIEITGDIPYQATRFINRTIRKDKRQNFDFNQLRKGYYRIIQSGVVNNFSPTLHLDSTNYIKDAADSLFTLKLRATRQHPLKLSLGGNISSSSLNQVFLGAEYLHAGMNPWRLKASVNLGRYYRGATLRFRHDIGVEPLAYYFADFVGHQYDYYNGNQNILRANKLPQNIQFREFFGRFGLATSLSLRKNSIAMVAADIGRHYENFFLTEEYLSSDKPDKASVFFVSPKILIKKNTLNYALYPTAGLRWSISGRYTFANEEYSPGSTNPTANLVKGIKHFLPQVRVMADRYVNFGKYFTLGMAADLVWSHKGNFSNYYSNIMSMPAFQPVPHAFTLLMEGYRANTFAGIGLSPVIKFREKLYLHTTASYFQPYRQTTKNPDGWSFSYSDKLPKGHWIANAALVWQSPIGPVSLSTTYYSHGEYKWYPQINIGVLIFNKKSIED